MLLVKFYKGELSLWDMNYEELLNEAYENVEVSEDSGERFEVVKVKGHHQGTKTIISNFGSVAAHIRRAPEHLLKFLGKELASQGEISGERLILSRKLPSKDINEKIERYVKEYVVCPKCGKPDSELNDDGGKVFLHCLACGEKREVHKL